MLDRCRQYLDERMRQIHDSFRNTEWGSEMAETMSRAVYNFELPPGKNGKVRKLRDLIDRTPKHLISKVALEEKVFDTWYGGRTVLLGDGKENFACLLCSAS